jgi:uncharacterized peroxidase-related enzyme
MPRIFALTDAQAIESRPLLEAVRGQVGAVPNVIRTLAHSPAALRGYVDLSRALRAGVLSAEEQETVALAVSQANACAYSLTIHTHRAIDAGLSHDEIYAARQGEGSPIAAFARKVTLDRGILTDQEVNDAHEMGLSDAQIMEILAHVALTSLVNYAGLIASPEIDTRAGSA